MAVSPRIGRVSAGYNDSRLAPRRRQMPTEAEGISALFATALREIKDRIGTTL